jgi:catechol 2,3-dioxygenase-like lactoylglutathione lyase family enzyme
MIKYVWSVTFCVSDLKRSTEFYEKTLGLEKKYAYPSYVGFQCGNLEIGLIPKSKTEERAGLSSPSVEFLVDDVDKACKELKDKGVKFIKELHDEPWGGRQASFTDPDSNVLEIVQINWKKIL